MNPITNVIYTPLIAIPVFVGNEGPEINYKLKLRRIHATTFGNNDTREKVNYKTTIKKCDILSSSKNGSRQKLAMQNSEMKSKDSVERCRSLPINLLHQTCSYGALTHLDNFVTPILSDASFGLKQHFDKVPEMGKPCNGSNEANNAVVIRGKCSDNLDILLKKSIERNTIMSNLVSSPSDSKKGYFYESVGGVYYSFGNSVSEDQNLEERKDECGIENILYDDETQYNKDNKKVGCDNAIQSDNVKWKDHNLHTLNESSEKGGETVDSGRQTSCSSPVSSSEDHSNNDKHIYAIARCTANIASLPGKYCCLI